VRASGRGWTQDGAQVQRREVPRPFNPATIKRMIEGPMPFNYGKDK